jgi:hypothetical protein
MVGSEEGVVLEGVEALAKVLSRLESGGGVREYQKGHPAEEVVVMVGGLEEVEADIEQIKQLYQIKAMSYPSEILMCAK